MQTRPPSAISNTRREQATRRAARRAQEEAAARRRRIMLIAGSVIVLVLAVLIAVRVLSPGSSSTAAPDSPAPPDVVANVTGVDPALLEQVGKGTAAAMPTPIRATVETGPNGLPLVTYVGAEYCPFCAGERWPLIIALSRFGTFSNLQLSHSAGDDVYPNTPTFSFVGSTFSSPYVEFNPVELQSNVRAGSGYQSLQTPTPAQSALLQKYDGPPYVPAQSAGSIPFTDIGGQYTTSGASYDVGLLKGITQAQIAANLSNPNSPQTQAILGSANVITAAICSATSNQPANVCSSPTVQSIQASLAAAPVPGQS